MKLVLEKKHENRIEFIISELPIEFANMVRRYSMSRIPVLAIDSSTFYDNTSVFWDEYIAHRLGLIPVITPDKTPKDAEIILSLDAEGPRTVYSGDFESSDKEIKFAKDKIPFATLGPNQRIRVEGKATLNTARKHAKFQAGIVGYEENDSSLKMFVESFYQMSPADVIKRSCDEIISDLKELQTAINQ